MAISVTMAYSENFLVFHIAISQLLLIPQVYIDLRLPVIDNLKDIFNTIIHKD